MKVTLEMVGDSYNSSPSCYGEVVFDIKDSYVYITMGDHTVAVRHAEFVKLLKFLSADPT